MSSAYLTPRAQSTSKQWGIHPSHPFQTTVSVCVWHVCLCVRVCVTIVTCVCVCVCYMCVPYQRQSCVASGDFDHYLDLAALIITTALLFKNIATATRRRSTNIVPLLLLQGAAVEACAHSFYLMWLLPSCIWGKNIGKGRRWRCLQRWTSGWQQDS